MMASPKLKSDLISADAYFAGELVSTVKHEFVDGMVYAMAGGTERHETIALNIAAHLLFLVPDGCKVFTGNFQLGTKNQESEWYHYPDVYVACGESNDLQHRRDDALVIFEVLSTTTERSDRYEKSERSKTLPKLQEYVLVEQLQKRLEIYRKRTGWQQEFLHPDAPLVLESIDQTLTFDQIYRRVHIETDPKT